MTQTGTRTRPHATHRLIASDKVEGTSVYNRQGERLGKLRKFMVDKRSGRAEYAVLSFGGLFGLGGAQYPLPWNALEYDTDKGGFVVDLDKDKLDNAPRYDEGEEPDYDPDYGRAVYDYYGVIYTY